MTILPTDTKDDIRRLHDIWVARLAFEYRCERSDVLAAILPQPTASQAPAARTSEPATPDVQAEAAPQTSADHSPETAPDPHLAAGETIQSDQPFARPEGLPEISGNPEATHSAAPAASPGNPTGTLAKHAAEGTLSSEPGEVQDRCVSSSPPPSPGGGDPADGAGIPPNRAPAPSAAFSPDAPSRADRMRALFADGKQPTAKEATIALGYSGPGPANQLAAKLGLTFRKVTKDELRANGLAARAKQVEQQRAKQVTTTEALKAAPAKPQEPVKRAGPPTPRSEVPPQPATTAAEPFDDDEPAPVVRKVTKAPTGRFYLRDAQHRYVHQSLEASPIGAGPLMTLDRKWAWFDNMERYRGAKKKWPELAGMRKEAAAS